LIRLFRLWSTGGKDLRLLWFALRNPGRPAWLLPALAILGLYSLQPLNFALPVLGVVDDFILLPLLLHLMATLLPRDIRAGFGMGSPTRQR
jgi:uncharacterized membrane protein YkvA (DUF1232 family)